ncbi:hypothetical protein LUZ63_004271 [Rhynchospora breviuscula]|uniref:Cytochrome b5 heme-binding domain-containing protein n=1 Tax=Rhynchospora breviuscula TaxID=2022672 RepID=A0A9Q0D276_9POAL|nr:hypothetical protein LUZ63_004271 [Rhynchospora breviuscula]
MTMDKDNITLLLSLISALFLLAAALAYLFPKPKSNNNKKGKATGSRLQLHQFFSPITLSHSFVNPFNFVIGGKFKHAQSTANATLFNVYDVTSYVEEHPGGDAILNNAGRDSTEGFYGPQHATRVFDMVDEFYIGDLKN